MVRQNSSRMSVDDDQRDDKVLDSKSGNEKPGWNPELVETLRNLLYSEALGSRELASELQRLEQKHQNAVYSELIYLLSHLRFEFNEAKHHWKQIVAHADAMQKRLGTSVDLRVALVSYFVEVNRRLKNPKIIELELFEQTQASAYRDELTGLWNFRLFREYLSREIQTAERYNTALSLVMIDIDNFKNYNDQNGHEAGNEALATIARLLTESLRKADVAARYGGEEFALILPSTSKTGAHQVAERTWETIKKHSFPHENTQPGGKLTVSIGIATYPADTREAGELVRCADRAMYVAKARGKNQIHLYGLDRRSYKRIDAALGGKFCVLAAEYRSLTTVNLSERGLLFLVDQNLPVGSLIDINLMLPESNHEIAISGRVVRVEEKESGEFEAAIRIVDIAARDRSLLAKHIREASACLDADDPESKP